MIKSTKIREVVFTYFTEPLRCRNSDEKTVPFPTNVWNGCQDVLVASHVCTWALHEDVCEWKPGAFVLCQKTGLLLHRQLSVSRMSLTSSAGLLTSNAPLMADKLIGLGQAGRQMGTFLRLRQHSKASVCFSGPSFQMQANYFHKMLRGNRFLLYGTTVKCQILHPPKLQNGKDRCKATHRCDVITPPQEEESALVEYKNTGATHINSFCFFSLTCGKQNVKQMLWFICRLLTTQ